MILRYIGPLSVDFSKIRISSLFVAKRFYIYFSTVTLILAATGPYPEVHKLSVCHQFVFWPPVVALAIGAYLCLVRFLGLIGFESFLEPVLIVILVAPLTVISVYYAEAALGLPIPHVYRFVTLMATNLIVIDVLAHFFAYFVLSDIENGKTEKVHQIREFEHSCNLDDLSELNSHQPSLVQGRFVWKSVNISYSSIIRIQADRQYVTIYTQSRNFFVRGSFAAAIKLLPEDIGLQVHRSHWVRFDDITRLVKLRSKYYVELRCGEKLPVARTRLNIVKRILRVTGPPAVPRS